MKSSPTQIGTDTTWNRLSMSGSNAGATKTDGTLWAWGRNSVGTLGQNGNLPTNYSSPIQIPGTSWVTVGHGGQGNTMMATKNV